MKMKKRALSLLLCVAVLMTGMVFTAPVGMAEETVTEIIVDNTDATVESSGTWTPGTTRNGRVGTNYVSSPKDDTGNTWFKWTVAVPEAGTYQVLYNQVQVNSNETNFNDAAPFRIRQNDSTLGEPTTNMVRSAGWYELGQYSFSAGNAEVVLYAMGKTVLADAVKFVYVTPEEPGSSEDEAMKEIIVDNTYAAKTGAWTVSSHRTGYYGGDYLTAKPGDGEKSVTWTPNIPVAGDYAVYCWYPKADEQSCYDVPYTVTDKEGPTTYLVAQTKNSTKWSFLGIHSFEQGTAGSVKMAAQGVNTSTDKQPAVFADAVRFVPLQFQRDTNYMAKSGTWSEVNDSSALGGSYLSGGSDAGLTSAEIAVYMDGIYSLQYHMPEGAAPEGRARVTFAGEEYDAAMSELDPGYNILGFVNLSETDSSTAEIEVLEGNVWADGLRLAYTGYNLGYWDFAAGIDAAGFASSEDSDWAADGTAFTGSRGFSVCENITLPVIWNIHTTFRTDSLDGAFGMILGGDEDGYIRLAYNADQKKFLMIDQTGEAALASEEIELNVNQNYSLAVKSDGENLSVLLDETEILSGRFLCTGSLGFFSEGPTFSVGHLFANQEKIEAGEYQVDLGDPQQTIWGLGVEIQSDTISSNNSGIPDGDTISVPNNLTQEERDRLYSDMLTGFRYLRLAGGLYYRGTDDEQKHLRERWDTQNEELAELISKSGMEGVNFEYWSPPPYFKVGDTYYNQNPNLNILKCFAPDLYPEIDKQEFLRELAQSTVDDFRYLKENGIPVLQFSLQNESTLISSAGYSRCYYTNQNYYEASKVILPIVKEAYPDLFVHANSYNGQYESQKLRDDPDLYPLVDAWSFHRIGHDSNEQIDQAAYFNSNKGSRDIPVINTEFEYLGGSASDWRCINTAQSIMNWMTFENSPTWYWLHALKPLGNTEASGYSLGFWRAPGDTSDHGAYNHIQENEWDYNYQNWNSLRGFLKYMPWNSVRYTVAEDEVRYDQRIMAFKTPEGKLVIALTNRSETEPFMFNIDTGTNAVFHGYRYTPQDHDEIELGADQGDSINPVLPPLSIEFWVQDEDDTMVMADGVELSETDLELPLNGTAQLEATVTPDDAANKNVTWTSDDSTIAKVDENGNVTPVKEGETKIVATAVSGNGRFKAECEVTVGSEVQEHALSVEAGEGGTAGILDVGESGNYPAGSQVTVKAEADDGYVFDKWESSDGGSFADAQAAQTVFTMPDNDVTITAQFKEEQAGTEPELNCSELVLKVGDTTLLTVQNTTPGAMISWSSSDDEKVSVSDTGLVEALAEGTATITAEVDGKELTCEVTVTQEEAPEPELNRSELTLKVGDSYQLEVGNIDENTEVTWSSSDEEKVSVSDTGLVEALAKGAATITAKVDDKELTCEVTVTAEDAPVPELNQTKLSIQVGSSGRLAVSNLPEGAQLTWSSDDPRIATVSDTGVVKGIRKGKTNVTADVNGTKLTCEVTVTGRSVSSASAPPSHTRKIVIPTQKKPEPEKPQTGGSLYLDTKTYEMAPNHIYDIECALQGYDPKNLKVYSSREHIAKVERLDNGRYRITGLSSGVTYIMFEVYDASGALLTHASVRVTVAEGAQARGEKNFEASTF